MREELRRAGGFGNEVGIWTSAQLTQRRNVAHRLAVAYQSYRKSIHDIENAKFRAGNSTLSASGNSGVSLRLTSDVIVLSSDASDNSTTQRARDRQQVVADTDSRSDQVIDLTE